MMIASRFRTVAMTACIAGAALGCYLVSLKVAAERAQATRLDVQLFAASQDLRHLATELGTRGRLVQLERWNADVLALTAPKAGQYLAGEMQLASLAAPTIQSAAAESAPDTPVARALQAPAAVAKVAYTPVLGMASTLRHSVSLDLDDGAQHATLRPATLIRAAGGALAAGTRRIAYLDGKISRP